MPRCIIYGIYLVIPERKAAGEAKEELKGTVKDATRRYSVMAGIKSHQKLEYALLRSISVMLLLLGLNKR